MWILYYSGIYLLVFAIRLSSLWNKKSRLWLSGRNNWKKDVAKISFSGAPRIWFHVSSLGEFEQARPVIENLKSQHPQTDIILTFFSPSGFTIRKNYQFAEVKYLPADLPGNASYWIEHIRPDLAVFVKYDLWPGFLSALEKKNIPAILISAHWQPGKLFGSWSVPLTTLYLKKFRRIFLQRSEYVSYFNQQGFENVSVAGDTRIDRSLALPLEADTKIPGLLQTFSLYDMVAGSTWPEDENLICDIVNTSAFRIIIAPHDISSSRISGLVSKLNVKYSKLSELKKEDDAAQVLVVDSIGLLAYLYKSGKVAYVGGGFGKGIHNILEPMAFGKPVIFGPLYEKFPEAVDAVRNGNGLTIMNTQDLKIALLQLEDPELLSRLGSASRNYLEEHSGASARVTNYILDSIPFPEKS